MTDRFITVPDSLELPAAVKVPVARLIGPTGAAATPADLGAAAAANLGNAAGLDVGATAGTVMAGDDARVTSLPSTYAPLEIVHHSDVWAGLFGGPAGAHPDARWTNTSHLTAAGLRAWADYVLSASPIPTTGTPKVVWFGDSWIAQDPTILTAALAAHNATATVVVSGVSGNTSTLMLARVAADVPADADYVIFNEPGVNDVYQGFTAQTVAENLAALVAAIRGKGAVPIFTGMVPLVDHATPSATRYAETKAQIGDGTRYPSIPAAATLVPAKPQADSLSAGGGLAKVTTGIDNTTFGVRAGAGLTAGSNNTFLGREAGVAVTTGNNNTAFGQNALRGTTTGSSNTAFGTASLAAATTATSCVGIGLNAGLLNDANSNIFIGTNAGYTPAGVAANATTTSDKQTIIGTEAGQSSAPATAQSEITAIGWRARSGGYNATAIGSQATASVHDATAIGRGVTASGTGSVAIGVDNGGVAAVASGTNHFVLGTANHQVKVPGRLNVATRTPTGSADTQGTVGDIAWDADYLYVKTGAGWKRAALTAW